MSSPTNPAATQHDAPEPFPTLNSSPTTPQRPNIAIETTQPRSREGTSSSTIQNRLRSASKTFQESSPPTGFMIASSQIASSIPTLTDIRRGNYDSEGWSGEGQILEKQRRASLPRRRSSQTGEGVGSRRSSNTPGSPREATGQDQIPQTVPEDDTVQSGMASSDIPLRNVGQSSAMATVDGTSDAKCLDANKPLELRGSNDTSSTQKPATKDVNEYRTTPFENGYEFPPKHKWTVSTAVFLKAAWGFFITPIGFLVVIYGLNIVAWGGMLFLLLCNASPAMCKPTCNDINSPRRIWIEIDSQILNALFCVTGFGTIPWRFRDLYYLMQYRLQKKEMGLRRLAGINRGWFRLAGSQDLPVHLGSEEVEAEATNVPERSIPFPINKTPTAPLTGIRAPPTKMWKLDFVIWTMVWNTFLQAVLSGFMWGYNRYQRPSWSTGLFVAFACIVAAAGGIMSFIEGKHVKAIEGVPVTEADQEKLKQDREAGVTHYNNIKDEKPKEKKTHEDKSGLFHRKQKAGEVVQVASAPGDASRS